MKSVFHASQETLKNKFHSIRKQLFEGNRATNVAEGEASSDGNTPMKATQGI